MDDHRREFMNLMQSDRSVTEYEAEFLRLCRYVQGMVASENERCIHFEDGLRNNLRVLIAPQRDWEFAFLVEEAKITKDVNRVKRQDRDRERGSAQPQRVVQQPLRGYGQVRGGNGMGHGQRASGRGAGQIEVRQPALVYTARDRDDRDAPDVIIGTFLIFDVPYTVLINIGSTHSYVASTVSKDLGILVKSISTEITVLSPLGQSVRVSKLYRDVLLVIQWVVFLENLMALPFGEFDLILGCEAYLAYVSVSDSGDSFIRDIKIVKDFLDVFPKVLQGLPPNREVEFRIELLPGLALKSITPYRMAPNELTELKAQLQELLDYGFICPSVSP
ncbi:uncharacterized protein [Gossypium hirsutum]|uniref:Uncharacterized protein n=1 Tax=Gossypium hirsutum TaxID=3635 RepID=A0A1U8NW91_GOSHI|nr:uncharacterized protein LOC107952380 [Gossypium hirsutum]